jgi:hypothetical protein
MMTVAAIMAGLLPIMWSHGTGAEVMQRIAVADDRRHGVVRPSLRWSLFPQFMLR